MLNIQRSVFVRCRRIQVSVVHCKQNIGISVTPTSQIIRLARPFMTRFKWDGYR